jgi:uncharacterized protein
MKSNFSDSQPHVFVPRGFLAAAAAGLLIWAPSSFAQKPPELPPLTTISRAPRLAGKFVWADLVTDDLAAAQRFYAGLFGWRIYGSENYLIGFNEDRPVCGMFQRPRPKDQSAHPRWFGYLSVSSVSGAESAVIKAGGKVLAAPQKFPKRGEQAVFADPEGALFGVVKSSSGDPPDYESVAGDWIWIQLMSRDAAGMAEFYRKVGGYEIVENTSSNRLSDYVLTSRGFARATVRTIPKAAESVRPTWLLFVRVKSLSDSVQLAPQLGGKVLIEPKPEFLDGKVAVIADPTGAAIGLLEWSEALLKGGK